MSILVNYTAAIELSTKTFAADARIVGRFFNSHVGHEQGEEAKTAPVKSFKVIDNKVYAETACAVFHIRGMNAVSLANFNTLKLPVYIKKADPEFDEMVRSVRAES